MVEGHSTDAAAFCVRVRPMLVGSLSLYCGDADVAEELAQDVLARVWDRWPEVAAMPSAEAWAYRVGLNLANSHYRRRAAERRARARRPDPRLPDEPDITDAVAVRQAVAALPPRQRAVVVLRFFCDMTVADTAELLHCAPGTVKATTHKAVSKLRALVDPVHVSEVPDGI